MAHASVTLGRKPKSVTASERRRRTKQSLVAAGVAMLPTYDMLYGSPADQFFTSAAMEAGFTEWGGDEWPFESASYKLPSENVVFADGGQIVIRGNDGTLASVGIHHGWFRVRVAAPSQASVASTCAAFRQAFPAAYLSVAEDPRVPITFWANSHFGPQPRLRRIEAARWTDIEGNYTSEVREQLDALMAWDSPESVDGQLLLWQGEPGTGKSWALRALASEWADWAEFSYITDPDSFFVEDPSYMINVLLADSYDVISLDGDVYSETDALGKWRILILEDTGELLSAGAKEKYGQGLSRLLNVVDGMIGQGLRVLALVTTNDELGTLHPAVTRPGRCASQIEFKPMTAEEVAAWTGENDAAEGATLAELYARKHEGEVALPEEDLTADANPRLEVEAHAGVTDTPTPDADDVEAPNPVVVNTIEADAEQQLADYWASHPDQRQDELEDSGFDPVDDAMDYWPVELAEPIHADVAATVGASGVLDSDSVAQWMGEEAQENDADEAALFAETLALASSPLEIETPAKFAKVTPDLAPFEESTPVDTLLASSPLTQLLVSHRETLQAAERIAARRV